MIIYTLYTNCLLRYLTCDIPTQAKKVRNLMSTAKKHQVRLSVCEPIFIETAVMLKNYFKYDRDKVFLLLSDLLAAPELEIENRDRLAKATVLYHETSVDFTDCILLIYAQTQRYKVFTFDSKLAQITD